jgi:hypothetical protein
MGRGGGSRSVLSPLRRPRPNVFVPDSSGIPRAFPGEGAGPTAVGVFLPFHSFSVAVFPFWRIPGCAGGSRGPGVSIRVLSRLVPWRRLPCPRGRRLPADLAVSALLGGPCHVGLRGCLPFRPFAGPCWAGPARRGRADSVRLAAAGVSRRARGSGLEGSDCSHPPHPRHTPARPARTWLVRVGWFPDRSAVRAWRALVRRSSGWPAAGDVACVGPGGFGLAGAGGRPEQTQAVRAQPDRTSAAWRPGPMTTVRPTRRPHAGSPPPPWPGFRTDGSTSGHAAARAHIPDALRAHDETPQPPRSNCALGSVAHAGDLRPREQSDLSYHPQIIAHHTPAPPLFDHPNRSRNSRPA